MYLTVVRRAPLYFIKGAPLRFEFWILSPYFWLIPVTETSIFTPTIYLLLSGHLNYRYRSIDFYFDYSIHWFESIFEVDRILTFFSLNSKG